MSPRTYTSPHPPAEDRFWSRVDRRDNGCWLWTGSAPRPGYGRFWVDGGKVYAHRFAYELLVGPIPEGTEIDHLCRTPLCVNPDHLEAVPHRVNILRSTSPLAARAQQTHCVNGHPFDAANTYVSPNGTRKCRTCGRLRRRRYRAQQTP